MRSSITIFLISLLVCQNFCATLSTKAQDIQYLESIRKTDFGRTVLQSLQLELKTGSKDAVENILTLLNKLRDDELAAQAADDAAWAEESQSCADNQARLGDEITEAKDAVDANNNNIDLLETSVSNNQASLEEAQSNLYTISSSLDALIAARESDHATYLEETASIAATITALGNGKEILSQLLAAADEGSFFEKKQGNVFAEFNNHITSANLKKGKFHGFVFALLKMLSKEIVADQELVNKVIDLIDELIDQLSNELTTLASNEKEAQDNFEASEANLSSQIGSLNASIADLQSEITTANSQILDLQSDNSNLEVTITNKSQELADRIATCTDDAAAYESTKETRAGEVDIIDQVISIFQNKFENVKEYLTENTF